MYGHTADQVEEVNALLQEAYNEIASGECAPLEPLHVLLAEERERYSARQPKSWK